MIVLQLFNSFERGGAEILTCDVLKNCDKKSVEQFLVVSKGGDLEMEMSKSGFPLFKIPRDFFYIGFIISLRRFVQNHRIDIIHVHNPLDVFWGKLSTLFLQTKVIYTVHSNLTNGNLLQRKYREIALRLTDVNLYVSKTLLNSYKHTFRLRDTHQVLYNGIDVRKMDAKMTTLKKDFNLDDNSILLGMVGNINNVRDHLTVCKALRKLVNRNPEISFFFAGEVQNRAIYNECYNYCSRNNLLSHVFFLGSRQDIPGILQALDLFVYSSNRDTFGIAVVEAMISGTPVVVNDIPVFKEITKNGANALLYKSKNSDHLAKQVSFLLENPELKSQFVENGMSWAKKNFSITTHIENLNKIYRDTIHN